MAIPLQEVLELSGTKALKQGFLRKKVRVMTHTHTHLPTLPLRTHTHTTVTHTHQCRMRNKWKPRKFVLLEKVPFLFYYKGSKVSEYLPVLVHVS